MDNKVTIHQPNYIPWIGFFNKIKMSDTLIILDTVDYSKNSVHNRNKIRTPKSWMYLTIPIPKIYHRKPLYDVRIEDNKWMSKHWKSILTNYSNAEHFKKYKDFFENLYSMKHESLVELNEKIIHYICQELGLKPRIIKSSDIGVDQNLKKTEMLLNILRKVNATTYISGSGGKKYIDTDTFKNIKLEFQDFTHPVYKQCFEGFIPNMSIIDMLFNNGKESSKII
ncbi:MAG: WbqC family protein [Candidatus Aenigmarchaeota archaeon]|nr:WbqC family protein [Candidatus Aenigmarchaeota archaeon]